MESDVLQKWEEAIGTNAVNVIKDTATQWVFYEYLDETPNAVLGLQIASLDSNKLSLIHWAGTKTSSAFRKDVCQRSIRVFVSLLEKTVDVIAKETNEKYYPFLMLDEVKVTDAGYYIEVGILKLEEHIYYLFAPAETEAKTLLVRALIFGQCYAICRALAPRSEYACNIVNTAIECDEFSELGLTYEVRQGVIDHVETAFRRNVFDSIASWKANP